MGATRMQWSTMLCAAVLACGQVTSPVQSAATAPKAAHAAGRSSTAPKKVLLIADTDGAGTTALINALRAGGFDVTDRRPPQYDWDGITPAPRDFDVVVHLDGQNYATSMPEATQQILEDYVYNGGGFIAAQWDGYEYAQGIQVAMPNLSLQGWGGKMSNNCNNCTMTWSADASQTEHPVLAGVPGVFSFYAEGHDSGAQMGFSDQQSQVLMRAPKGGPAVLAREYGVGHVVQFAVAPNHLNGNSLQDLNLQQLYVNAAAWAGTPVPTAPVANAGADQMLEATGPQTSVVLDGSASAPDATYAWAEGATPLASTITAEVQLGVGVHTIVLTVTNTAGFSATSTTTVTILDRTPPALSMPADAVAEAGSAAGAAVTFSATASDLVDGSVAPSCDRTSGSVFAIGTTIVSCTATDSHGNAGHGSFGVTVRDTTPPVLSNMPASAMIEASSGAGAVGVYGMPSASDAVDGNVSVNCSPASGSTFPIGITVVTCSATDAHGNTVSAGFSVTVMDTTSPLLSLPTAMTVEATSAAGAAAQYQASAVDWVDGALAASCSPASGSVFPLGTSTVSCTAADSHGNTTSGSFTITVRDTTPPVLANVPADMTGQAGVAVTWAAPTASDAVDGSVAGTCSPASGSTFPIGVTLVTCSASDAHGNSASASFTVTVNDTVGPVMHVPADMIVAATSIRGAKVTYTATAEDAVDGSVAVTCSPPSGSWFPIGTTLVNCSAADSHGNTSTASFRVNVQFHWSGLLRPVHADGTSVFKGGEMVPVWFRLTDESAQATDVTARLYVESLTGGSTGIVMPALSWHRGYKGTPPGNVFKYFKGYYYLGFSPKGLSPGKYVFLVDLGDGVQRATTFTVRK